MYHHYFNQQVDEHLSQLARKFGFQCNSIRGQLHKQAEDSLKVRNKITMLSNQAGLANVNHSVFQHDPRAVAESQPIFSGSYLRTS